MFRIGAAAQRWRICSGGQVQVMFSNLPTDEYVNRQVARLGCNDWPYGLKAMPDGPTVGASRYRL